jgi:hypothetical protein
MRRLALLMVLTLAWPAHALGTEVVAAGVAQHSLVATEGYASCDATMWVAVEVDFATASATLRGADAGPTAATCPFLGDQFLDGKCVWEADTTVRCAQAFEFPGDGTSSWSRLQLDPDGALDYAYHYGNPNPGHPSYDVRINGHLARA